MPEGERFDQAKFVRVLKIEGKCSCLRAKAADISGHLPGDRQGFINVMRHAIALNGSFFNTQRMMQQYVVKAYFL